MSRCVKIDGVLLHVDSRFDATPGSADMLAAAELVASIRASATAKPVPLDERPLITDAGSRSRRS